MLTRKMVLAAALVGVIGAGAAATASAQGGPGGPEGWHHGGMQLLEGITLTDEQTATLRTLMQDGHAGSRALRQQMRAVHERIETTLLSSGTVTAATLAPLVQQQEALMQQLDAQRIAQEVAVHDMLTPAQLSQAAAAHAQLEALHQQEHTLRGGVETPPD